jgi:hypothetical protein
VRLTQLDWEYVEPREQRLLTAIGIHINGLKHGWKVFKWAATGLCPVPVSSEQRLDTQALSRGGLSFAQTFAVSACAPGRYVLQLGIGNENVSTELRRRLCRVTATRSGTNGSAKKSRIPGLVPAPRLPENLPWFDHILVMNLIEYLPDPEKFMEGLRRRMARRGSEVIITVTNVAFVMPRIMLALSARHRNGKNNLKSRHLRAFTFKSLHMLLEQAGFEVVESRGVPAPFLTRSADNRWSRVLLKVNQLLLRVSKRLFAYQICIRARPNSGVHQVFQRTIPRSAALPSHSLGRAA